MRDDACMTRSRFLDDHSHPGAPVYVKLFSTITESSIWDESQATRLVWITLLTMADEKGYARSTIAALARRANVPLKDTKEAVAILKGPDIESHSPEFGGARIYMVDGGWMLVNYEKYRAIQTGAQRQSAEASARYRARKRDASSDVTGVTTEAEADTEAKAEGEARVAAAASRKYCECCHAELKHPPEKYVTLDHDHETGQVRGWICKPCNKLVGQLETGMATTSTKRGLAEAYIAYWGSKATPIAAHIPEQHHEALNFYLIGAGKHRPAVEGEMRAALQGMWGHEYSGADVGRALHEMMASKKEFTPRIFRGWLRGLDDPKKKPRSPGDRAQRNLDVIDELSRKVAQ